METANSSLQVFLVVFHPIVHLSLSQTQDVLLGVGRILSAVYVQEIQATGSLEQNLFVASRITKETNGVLLHQSSGFGIILFLADNLLHGTNLLSAFVHRMQLYNNSLENQEKSSGFRK